MTIDPACGITGGALGGGMNRFKVGGIGVLLCAVITAFVLSLMLRRWGVSPLIAALVLLACPIAMAYAWWIERRMERDVRDAIKRFGRTRGGGAP